MTVNVEPLHNLFQNQFNIAVSLYDVLTRGAGKIAAEAQDYSKSSLAANLELAQKLAAVKSPSELLELQSAHAKALYELSVTRSRKIGELVTDLSKQAAESFSAGAEKSAQAVQAASENLAQAAE